MALAYQHSQHTTCAICKHEAINAKKLSFHIFAAHGLKSLEYTIKYLTPNGQHPVCPACGIQTRYVAYSFKTYCKDHSSLGESAGGKKGGTIKKTWNKGETKETHPTLKVKSEEMMGEKNHFSGQKHTEESRQKISDNKRLPIEEYEKRVSSKHDKFTCLTPYEQYNDRQETRLQFQCMICSSISFKTLFDFERRMICRTCDPGISVPQAEIEAFVRSLGVDIISNDRTVLGGKELDVYVPTKKFAVEYDSFHYHMWDPHDPNDPGKDRHYAKSAMCWKNDIDLMHVYTDEWRDKRPIVESMIRHRLGMTQQKFNARDLTVKEISMVDARAFFNANHIAGNVAGGEGRLGLYSGNELIVALSLRKPFMKRYVGLAEIARFASKLDTHVVGGLARLVKHARDRCMTSGFKGLMTYADLRFGRGASYERVGFKFEDWTKLNYDYTDGQKRIGRHTVKAREDASELDVAEELHLNRIYGCGSNMYVMMFDQTSWSPPSLLVENVDCDECVDVIDEAV